MKKQINNIFLGLIFFIPVMAAVGVGILFSKTKDVVYIQSSDELYKLREKPDGNFEITCKTIVISTEKWIPIGTFDTPFSGTLNGNGVEIIFSNDNFNFVNKDISYAGFIGYNTGTIENLNFYVGKTYEIKTNDLNDSTFSLLTAYNYGTIESCKVYGAGKILVDSKSEYCYLSSFVGHNYGKIYHCKNDIDWTITGGIKNLVFGTICSSLVEGSMELCTSRAKTVSVLNNEHICVGGLAGISNGKKQILIQNCSSLTKLTVDNVCNAEIGGVIGSCSDNAMLTFKNLYIGFNLAEILNADYIYSGCCNLKPNSNSEIRLENCYSAIAYKTHLEFSGENVFTFLNCFYGKIIFENCFYSEPLLSEDEKKCNLSKFNDLTFEMLNWDENIWERDNIDFLIK